MPTATVRIESEPTGEKWREGSLKPHLAGITDAEELERVKNFLDMLAIADGGLQVRNNVLLDQLYGRVPDCRSIAWRKMEDSVRHRGLSRAELSQDALVSPYYWLWCTEPDIDLEVPSTVGSGQILEFAAMAGIYAGRYNLMSDYVWRQLDAISAATDPAAQIVRYQYCDLRAGPKGRTVFTIATDHSQSFRYPPCFNLDSLMAPVTPDLNFCFADKRLFPGEILEAEKLADDPLRAIYAISRAIYLCAAHGIPLYTGNSASVLRSVLMEVDVAQLPPSIMKIVQRNSALAALFNFAFTLEMEEKFGLQGFV